MVTVYIWNFRGKSNAWGHASALVNSQYISWWPMASNRVRSRIHNDIYEAHPIGNRLFIDDIREEGGNPNHTIRIHGLNESRILSWWRRTALSWGGGLAQGPPSVPWSSLGWNCSKIVATALKEGGGDLYSSFLKSYHFIWTPNDVKSYAESIVNGMQKIKL